MPLIINSAADEPQSLKHELSEDDINLFPRFPVGDNLQDDFISPHFFFRDHARLLCGGDETLARQLFAAFLEGLRGPYYVTENARARQTLMIKLLHIDDRAEFAAKYPQWQAAGATHNNASFLVRAMLDNFHGVSFGMRAVMTALRGSFDRMPHAPQSFTRLEFLAETKIVERGKGAAPEGRAFLIHFVNAAMREAFPTPRRDARGPRPRPLSAPHPGRSN